MLLVQHASHVWLREFLYPEAMSVRALPGSNISPGDKAVGTEEGEPALGKLSPAVLHVVVVSRPRRPVRLRARA